jgi:gamma-glutamyl-gamma-aminobutyraldehyde dehydrogenase
MSVLLTKEEFESVAGGITLPTEAFINGEYVAARSGKTLETINPATGQVITRIASCEADDVDRAVQHARKAFDSGVWAKKHPIERKTVLLELVKQVAEHQRELAVLESVESGKPIRDCVEIDLPETMSCLQWHAEVTDKLYGQVSPSGEDALGLIVKEPMGVVACVLPWNFPLMMLAWKIGPALAAGNSVIVKPAEETSMTALKLAELAREAGIPPGVLSVVPGPGEITGRAVGLHPGINAVSFTGSTEVGREFLRYSADSNLKRIVLECGGKNPCIVLADAGQLDDVATHAVLSVFWNSGQNCTSNSRLIVEKGIKEPLMEKIIEKTAEWPTGYPLDPANRLGAIVTRTHFDKIMGYIDVGRKEGASVVLGGDRIEEGNGLYIEPTVFDGVTPGMTIARDEIFGPVLSVIEVNDVVEAVNTANDTAYGLQASLFTSDVTRAHRIARELQAGTVSVNCYGEGDMATPFGGYKQSGFGGRDKSLMAHDQYCETKTIWLDLSDPAFE